MNERIVWSIQGQNGPPGAFRKGGVDWIGQLDWNIEENKALSIHHSVWVQPQLRVPDREMVQLYSLWIQFIHPWERSLLGLPNFEG